MSLRKVEGSGGRPRRRREACTLLHSCRLAMETVMSTTSSTFSALSNHSAPTPPPQGLLALHVLPLEAEKIES
eukprot:2210654-Pleurochrysis_carterae.AAC.2